MNARKNRPNKHESPGFIRAIIRLGIYLASLAILALTIGFFVFLLKISSAKPPSPLQKSDGIVVLTGSDGQRLARAAELLKQGKGEKLFISGVNKSVKPEEIKQLLAIKDELFNCCVDLDFEAQNTYDNGRETAIWLRSMDYETIILVTSDYHMPRALLELNSAIDSVGITAYPIKTAKPANAPWWGGRDRLRLFLREYSKLLISLAKNPGARPDENRQ